MRALLPGLRRRARRHRARRAPARLQPDVRRRRLPVRWSEEEYADKLAIGAARSGWRTSSPIPTSSRARSCPPTQALGPTCSRSGTAPRPAHFTSMDEAGAIPARPGIAHVVSEALAVGWVVAVCSTSAIASVTAVLHHDVGEEASTWVPVYAGDVVPAKKPDPATYLLTPSELGLNPAETLVLEDARNGLVAVDRAGLRCVVTVSSYTPRRGLHRGRARRALARRSRRRTDRGDRRPRLRRASRPRDPRRPRHVPRRLERA